MENELTIQVKTKIKKQSYYGISTIGSKEYTAEEFEKIIGMLDEEVYKAFRKYPIEGFKGCDDIEDKKRELHFKHFYAIKSSYKEIIHQFLGGIKAPVYSPQGVILYSIYKCELIQEYFYLIGLESCIKVCERITSEENKNSKELNP